MLLQAPLVVDEASNAIVDGDLVISFFKLLFVAAAFLYVLFAFVVTRQIKIMRTTLITPFSPIVNVVGLVHLAVSILILLSLIFLL